MQEAGGKKIMSAKAHVFLQCQFIEITGNIRGILGDSSVNEIVFSISLTASVPREFTLRQACF